MGGVRTHSSEAHVKIIYGVVSFKVLLSVNTQQGHTDTAAEQTRLAVLSTQYNIRDKGKYRDTSDSEV